LVSKSEVKEYYIYKVINLLSSVYKPIIIFSVSFYSLSNLPSTTPLSPRSQISFAYYKYYNALTTPNKKLVLVEALLYIVLAIIVSDSANKSSNFLAL